MISTIRLKNGRSPGSSAEPIIVTPVTVFVGPNNSGKSRVLSEIERLCRTGEAQSNALVLGNISFIGFQEEKIPAVLEQITRTPKSNESLNDGHVITAAGQVPSAMLVEALKKPTDHHRVIYCKWFLTFKTLMLDGKSRINLVKEQNAGDLQQVGTSSLQTLFNNNSKRLEVRRIILDAFSSHFVIDPTSLGKLRIRFSSAAQATEMVERGIHAEAVQFHAAAQLIDDTSDGVKAFTGIITQIIAGDPSVILIDEPEAFLHPSLASKLGTEISKAAYAEGKRVFVSTHSSSFVMGCIQAGVPLNIIRLTYRSNVATARVLPSAEVLELMRHPLLRSTGVLNGLFYEFVVVTESDADRAFYQEINERLLQFRPDWGIPNCLFINAQNKQTVPTIVRPLRQLGIPAAGIVDIDVVKEGGTVWTGLLTSIGVPSISHGSLATLRAAVKAAMVTTGKDMKREGGVDILPAKEREAANNLLSHLMEYGMFTVPKGELESWLKPLGIGGHGPNWLTAIFERMGEDPAIHTYVKPENGDVWEFLATIRSWLVDVNRKGIPE